MTEADVAAVVAARRCPLNSARTPRGLALSAAARSAAAVSSRCIVSTSLSMKLLSAEGVVTTMARCSLAMASLLASPEATGVKRSKVKV